MSVILLSPGIVRGQTHVARDATAVILSAILMPPINLAISERGLDPKFALWIETLDLSGIDDIRFTCDVDDVPRSFANAAAAAGYPNGYSHLQGDIMRLARNFGDIIHDPQVEIRLEIVESDACHRFHADYVTARLITTYCGPGTQWLSAADAEALKAGAALTEIGINQLEVGDVALFKGCVWSPEGAIIHRSPPIAGTGTRRLVLVINPGREAPTVIV